MDPDGRGVHPRRSKSIECSVFLGLGRALAKSAVVALGVYPGSDPGLQVRTRRSSSLVCFPLLVLTRNAGVPLNLPEGSAFLAQTHQNVVERWIWIRKGCIGILGQYVVVTEVERLR